MGVRSEWQWELGLMKKREELRGLLATWRIGLHTGAVLHAFRSFEAARVVLMVMMMRAAGPARQAPAGRSTTVYFW